MSTPIQPLYCVDSTRSLFMTQADASMLRYNGAAPVTGPLLCLASVRPDLRDQRLEINMWPMQSLISSLSIFRALALRCVLR